MNTLDTNKLRELAREGATEQALRDALLSALDEVDQLAIELDAMRENWDHARFERNRFCDALRRVKFEAASLADAQVIALEALGKRAALDWSATPAGVDFGEKPNVAGEARPEAKP